MTKIVRAMLASLAAAIIAAPAFAHSTVKSTVPVSGSIMPSSPPEIVINFNQEARLTSIVVVEPGKPERRLEFMPSGAATSFMVHDPKLSTGRNEIKWKALSKDGHPIDGTIIVVIKPGAKPYTPSETHQEHQGH
jgi:methionine-rich copper-binding protein CopC